MELPIPTSQPTRNAALLGRGFAENKTATNAMIASGLRMIPSATGISDKINAPTSTPFRCAWPKSMGHVDDYRPCPADNCRYARP